MNNAIEILLQTIYAKTIKTENKIFVEKMPKKQYDKVIFHQITAFAPLKIRVSSINLTKQDFIRIKHSMNRYNMRMVVLYHQEFIIFFYSKGKVTLKINQFD